MRAVVETVRFTRIFPGRADQVSQARHEIAHHLTTCNCPVTADAVLIISEFASNAVLHSDSQNEFFTVRANLFPGYVQIECEDLGGQWNPHPRDPDRPHGLDVVEALTGADGWGINGGSPGRVAWARLEFGT
jgi:anti-sigma regulatory factor (Ser/Thr protein kinase)